MEIKEEQKEIPRKAIIKIMNANKNVNEVFDLFVAGKSKIRYNTLSRELGILDHIFIGGGLEWHIYVRVIPNQTGSTTTWTFIRPDGLTEEQFEEQLKGFDNEI